MLKLKAILIGLINAALWLSNRCVLAAVYMPSNCMTAPWLS